MARYNGVTLNSCGQYWSAAWVNDQGKRTLKSLGSKKSLTRGQAERKCKEIAAGHAKTPELRNTSKSPTISEWADRYLELRSDLAPSTLSMHRSTLDKLLSYLDDGLRLNDISRSLASDWRLCLEQEYYLIAVKDGVRELISGESTVCKYCKIAKQIFKRAVEMELMAVNTFSHLKSTPPLRDQSDRRFVDFDEFMFIAYACPDQRWRTLIALCYYAGLRRSEALRLKWGDVHWDKNRLVITNPRGHITSKNKQREVLINEDLTSVLLDRFEDCKDGDEYVCDLWSKRNMASRVVRSIVQSSEVDDPDGITLQAMRATRDSIWHALYPAFVCNAWLGHSEAVAQRHYLTVPEEYYD